MATLPTTTEERRKKLVEIQWNSLLQFPRKTHPSHPHQLLTPTLFIFRFHQTDPYTHSQCLTPVNEFQAAYKVTLPVTFVDILDPCSTARITMRCSNTVQHTLYIVRDSLPTKESNALMILHQCLLLSIFSIGMQFQCPGRRDTSVMLVLQLRL